MAFDSKPTSGQSGSTIDFDAMNQEIVDICGTQNKKRSLVGIISGVIDLGMQEQPDSEVLFKGDEAEEKAEIEKNKNTYFKTVARHYDNGSWVQNARLKCWPNAPRHSIAITVDFPQIMIDKGKYFGNSNPAPLRMLLNGEFTVNGERGLGRLFPVTWELLNKDEVDKNANATKIFSIRRTSTLYKLGNATGVIADGAPMTGADLPSLLGKAAQFEIQVKLNESNGRKFLNEKIKLAGVIPEGLPIPEIDPSLLYTFEFDSADNNPEQVKIMRASIKNTIKKANNFKGNVVEALFAEEAKPAEVSKASETTKVDESVFDEPEVNDAAFEDFDDNDDVF